MSRLVIYVHDLRTSGVVRDSLNLAAHCARHRPVTLIAGHRSGFLGDEARQAGYEVLCLRDGTAGKVGRMLAVPHLRRWLRRQGPCVLVSMGNMGHATPYFASRGLPHVQRIYRISNEVERGAGARSWVRRRWMRLLIDDAARLPLVGAALASHPLFAPALQRGIAVQMASGVDVARARQMAHEPAPHRWLDEDVPVVLGIGRLRRQKNFGLLIEGVARLRQRRRVRLVIVGGGSGRERAVLTEHAARVGLGEDFLLAGETHNVFSWLSRAGVFVLPSRWEGSSVALVEALAVGTPVVASVLAGDARQVLDEGLYGRLFDGVDPQALAEAIDLQLSGHVIRPGDRALRYGEPWEAYRGLIEEVEAEVRYPGSLPSAHSSR
jgi:glycosyltransferase involved in cell wall biosynthesis